MKSKLLPHCVTIYVPEEKFDRQGEHYSALVKAAGGATVACVDGAYIMEDGTLCVETVYAVRVFYRDQDMPAVEQCVGSYVQYLLKAGEEAVAVEWGTADLNLYTK